MGITTIASVYENCGFNNTEWAISRLEFEAYQQDLK